MFLHPFPNHLPVFFSLRHGCIVPLFLGFEKARIGKIRDANALFMEITVDFPSSLAYNRKVKTLPAGKTQ